MSSPLAVILEVECMKTTREFCREIFRANPQLLATDDPIVAFDSTYTRVFEIVSERMAGLLNSGRLNLDSIQMTEGMSNVLAEFQSTLDSVRESDLIGATR